MPIHCISFYEDDWLVRQSDRQQWNHATGAYGASYQLYQLEGFAWNDAIHNPHGLAVYVFDETGDHDSRDGFLHPDDGVYVFGITRVDVLSLVPAESINGVVKITTPVKKCLWGCEAAAVALDHRYTQLGY